MSWLPNRLVDLFFRLPNAEISHQDKQEIRFLRKRSREGAPKDNKDDDQEDALLTHSSFDLQESVKVESKHFCWFFFEWCVILILLTFLYSSC